MIRNVINPEKLYLLNKLVDLILNETDAKEFYLKNKEQFSKVTPFEVFSITAFVDENQPIERIKEIAGKMINLLRNGLLEYEWNKNFSLIQKLLQESNKIKQKFSALKELIKQRDYDQFRKELDFIFELKKRFLKMQNVIFAILEKKLPNPKPFKVMWSLHDDVIHLHKQLQTELEANSPELNITIGKYFFLVFGILEKEELLILPTLSSVLTLLEMEELEKEVDSYGYAFISEANYEKDVHYKTNTKDYLFTSKNGKLNLDELISILNCVGDISFVDSDNIVKFFNAPNKHFPRTASIIGRDVRDCHPSKSVHIVMNIIERFRTGKENRVDFWINMKGKLILISYFAIRNNDNQYLGVLELTQDISDISKITGEKRIIEVN